VTISTRIHYQMLMAIEYSITGKRVALCVATDARAEELRKGYATHNYPNLVIISTETVSTTAIDYTTTEARCAAHADIDIGSLRKLPKLAALKLAYDVPTKVDSLDEHTPGWRTMKHKNGKPVFALDGTMLDDKGNRSIFDDVDE
jgi:hypothetical protein